MIGQREAIADRLIIIAIDRQYLISVYGDALLRDLAEQVPDGKRLAWDHRQGRIVAKPRAAS
jgi:hypothetical protein